MPLVAAMLWDVLTAAGSTVALGLIVAIALGINAMALLFMGSAVVALERFARAARSWKSALCFGAVWSLVLGAFALYVQSAELAGEDLSKRFQAFGLASAGSAVVVAVLMGVTRVALTRVSPMRLAAGTLTVLGGSGRVFYAAIPALVSAALALVLLIRRRRAAHPAPPGDAERMLRVLAAALAVGVPVALFVTEPTPALAMVGGQLLAAVFAAVVFGLLPAAASGIYDTRNTAEWFIAVRYLLAKRRQTFISVITGICVIGIAAGVWLVITVLSVMNGFERTWRDEIIGNRAHFTVHNGLGPFEDYEEVVAQVEAAPDVLAASPYLDVEGMVRGDAGEIVAVRVRGVDPARVANVTDLRDDLVTGSLDRLDPAVSNPDQPAILIGSQLAASLGVGVGDPLLLISPFGGPQTPLGPAPRLKRFEVAGVFESSFFQYDEMFTYVNLSAAQEFRRVGDVVDGIEARTTDFYRSRAVADGVQSRLGFPYYARDWKEFFPAFFQALKSERVMMFILLTMIMVVAAFSIVSTLVMMIMEKSSDIAILKAMGAEDDGIERIFALEGTLIGVVGTTLGVVAGLSVTARIEWIQRQIEAVIGIDTLPASVYQFSTLPAEFDAGQIALAVGIAMILSLGATLLPSRQAARLDPVESLRYE
jgi:lipoprotein-releasing system permease protein